MVKNKTKKITGSKNVPIGVKIISILGYIQSALILLLGIGLILGAKALASFVQGAAGSSAVDSTLQPILAGMTAGVFIALGVLLLVFAICEYFIVRGLWTGKNWARILVIVLSNNLPD